MKNNKRSRIVVDTNVLISALVFGGKPRQVIDLFAEGRLSLVTSEEILTELRHKIGDKFPEFLVALRRLEKLLERDAQRVVLGFVRVKVCRDPDDNKLIETALIGGCDYIVSGDNDLLVLKHYEGIRIVKPAEFIELI